MYENITVKGARVHNLKNITVTIPRNKLTVITGLSGSGKSSLAFDTIYAEGQRRYVESLSAYARQFLGIMQKPDVDTIEGLSPAISIEQKTTSKNPRSTVGTVTEIYDYLRLLFARVGMHHCPNCHESIKPQSAENIVELLLQNKGKKYTIVAPILEGVKGTHEKVFERLQADGYTRVRVDGEIHRLEDLSLKLGRYEKHWIEAVIDRVTISDDERSRITEAIEQALQAGKGICIAIPEQKKKTKAKEIARGKDELRFSTYGACTNHPEIVFEPLEPRMFSFNSPFGACQTCSGLGEQQEIDPELLIPNKELNVMNGAIAIYGKMDTAWRSQQIAVVGKKYGFDVFTPIEEFTDKQLQVLLYGTDEPIEGTWSNGASMNMQHGWEGIIPQSMRLYHQTESAHRKEKIEKFMRARPCPSCKGQRLKETILAVLVGEKSIIEVTDMSVKEATAFFKTLPKQLTDKEKYIAKQILKEITDRLSFLVNVGLGYLNLSRSARTLSGGEAQRIRLATQIGANLMGVLYVLDEPSIGLHQRDNAKLIKTLCHLRDIGNTLLVVEHDEDTIHAADYVLDIGPGAGVHGGHVCAQGTPKELAQDKKSVTGDYLAGRKKIAIPNKRREPTSFIEVKGASENNLQKVNVSFPLGVLCGVTGVSGSGKSTLVTQTVLPALQKNFGQNYDRIGKHKKIILPLDVKNVIVINQDPIGKTPRSNPATYTKIFDLIRDVFAATKESRARGYGPGRFSFNVKGGRCENCSGDGTIKIEMNFLPDVYVECDQCHGKRYNKETLGVLYKGRNIADVLEMSVEEALGFFANHSGIKRKLQTLFDVGLGYIKLGQSAVTLSGGESQRIKLTRELAKVKRGNTVYVLDEPTTGLHFEDVRKLLVVLDRLVEKGNSIFVIEHNLDLIKCCDYLIDMGPEGGDGGGFVVATGTPEEVAKNKDSYTGQFLKKLL